jgi:hypothetical protein
VGHRRGTKSNRCWVGSADRIYALCNLCEQRGGLFQQLTGTTFLERLREDVYNEVVVANAIEKELEGLGLDDREARLLEYAKVCVGGGGEGVSRRGGGRNARDCQTSNPADLSVSTL